MISTKNLNILKIEEMLKPEQVLRDFPINENISQSILNWRNNISNILNGSDKRLLAVVGPCSIHDYQACIEYAKELKKISDVVSKKILVVMRVYFEKPRTTVGWKGLINDPYLDNSFEINKGICLARKILLDINEIGLPVGCEFLDVFTPQYLADLITWGAIGARTTESQLHRQLASGLSVPIGFKNGTGGTIGIAADAIISAANPHVFIGINDNGVVSKVTTKGNKNCHIILRGGSNGPNYHPQNVEQALEILKLKNVNTKIMIDCSHGNSNKNHLNQEKVLDSLIYQIRMGNSNIFGFMIESNINEGKQKCIDKNNLEYGVSITDACINLETTKRLLMKVSQISNPVEIKSKLM